MRKISMFFVLALLCCVNVFAQRFEVDGICYDFIRYSNGTVSTDQVWVVESYNDEMVNKYTGAITIPATVTYEGTTYNVTGIGRYAFSYCTDLTSITIPESVTTIGDNAFYGCDNLNYNEYNDAFYLGNDENPYLVLIKVNNTAITTYTIPEQTKIIYYEAFSDCSALTSITIPENITAINGSAFYGCTGLTSVVWNAKNCTEFEGYYSTPFYDLRSQITSFTFGDKVEHIPAELCYGNENLTSVTIPNSVTSIGQRAFYGCSGLTSVTIPESVTSIGRGAFYGCSGLTSISISQSVIKIEPNAFGGCSNIEHVTVEAGNSVYHSDGNCIIETATRTLIFGCKNSIIPDDGSVTSIGESAFNGCSGLTSITIPESVTSIGDYAFYGCSGLASVSIPNSVTSIGIHAFYGLHGNEYDNALYLGNEQNPYLILVKAKNRDITSCNVHAQTKFICNNSFDNCNYLKTLVISSSVVSIGLPLMDFSTQNDFSRLESIVVESGNTKYHSTNNCLIETETKKLLMGCINSIIPADGSVTSIAFKAFNRCYMMRNLTIPETITSVGGWSFMNMWWLDVVEWNAKKCVNLTMSTPFYSEMNYIYINSFVLGENVEVIPDYLCQELSSIDSITIPKSVKEIGRNAFNVSRIWERLHKTNYTGTITDWCKIKFANEKANPVATSKNLYINNVKVEDLVIPDGVDSIGSYAFVDCESLTSITIPKSVKRIGTSAFSIEKTASSSRKTNYTGTIADWCKIEFADAWANPICASNNLFINNLEIKDLTIPNDVDVIGNYAFVNCDSLVSITIPKTVTAIGAGAFSGCSAADSITVYAATPPTVGTDAFTELSPETPLVVTCEAVEAYQSAEGWSDFSTISEEFLFKFNTTSSNEEFGLIQTLQNPTCSQAAIVNAIPRDGYEFESWSDGNTSNPRILKVTSDTTLMASFVTKSTCTPYTLMVLSANNAQGSVNVLQSPSCENNNLAVFQAVPSLGYQFLQWNDGNISNPRVEFLTDNAVYIASFSQTTALEIPEVIEGIYAQDGGIYGAEDLQIFNLVGQDITHLNGALNNGVYLVKVGDKTQKVFVK